MLSGLLAFFTQIILPAASSFIFKAIDEIAVVLGKLFPDDPPLGKPEGMLLKIYSASNSASKAFDVSSATINSEFSRTGCCLSNAPCDWPERVTEDHDSITNLHNCPG